MRKGFLLLLVICAGCSHRSQFEPTHCGWGDLAEKRTTADAAAAADRSAAEAWKAQQERLINASNSK